MTSLNTSIRLPFIVGKTDIGFSTEEVIISLASIYPTIAFLSAKTGIGPNWTITLTTYGKDTIEWLLAMPKVSLNVLEIPSWELVLKRVVEVLVLVLEKLYPWLHEYRGVSE